MIQENISLKPYNTFGIDVQAKRFTQVNSITELQHLFKTLALMALRLKIRW